MSPPPLQFLFMGTGTSTGLPLTPCLTLSHSYPEAFTSHVPRPVPPPKGSAAPAGHYDPAGPWPRNIECACCRSAVDPDVPEGWKNKRGNTSAIVRRRGADGVWKNVLVDCGKTFLEQARSLFPRFGVQTIDAVLLTHGHADAYFGLDDLREWCIRQKRAIPIYLDQPTYDIVARSFPYLVDASKASGGGDVPTLTWNVINEIDTFDVCGIPVRSFPAYHGVYFSDPTTGSSTPSSPTRTGPSPLICLAFMFDQKVLYMGDVSEIPERTWKALGVKRKRSRARSQSGRSSSKPQLNGTNGHDTTMAPAPTANGSTSPAAPASASTATVSNGMSSLNTTDDRADATSTPPDLPVFVVDALWPLRSHASHFSLAQAMDAALELKPLRTYTIGSTHPTTHFMWEEVCRSFNDEDNRRPDHPDAEISRGLVAKVKANAAFGGNRGIRERWAEWGGRIEPGYDGLLLEVSETGVEVLDAPRRG